ncbi:hypothetical protein HMPREF9689_00681 [Klebsiella oxytoca 10-5245]|nr:hypothetical protein HMPREF9689_00681 [Klebsiella oxytoca 10-5245]
MISSKMRTQVRLTSHREIAKVSKIIAIARGFAPGGMARYFCQ